MRCPECGRHDMTEMRVYLHRYVIYHCPEGHGWKKPYIGYEHVRPPESDGILAIMDGNYESGHPLQSSIAKARKDV